MRKARFRLWRLTPPFTTAVEVHRISVGGFLELLRALAPRAAEVLLREAEKGRVLSDLDLIYAMADDNLHREVAVAADLVCVDRPVGFLRSWLRGRFMGRLARRNTNAFMTACREVEGDGQWTRFLACLNRNPAAPAAKGKRKKKSEGGGMGADVLVVARMFGCLPSAVEAMHLQDFLNLTDAINAAARSQEPDAPDADDEPVPISELMGLGGGAVFH